MLAPLRRVGCSMFILLILYRTLLTDPVKHHAWDPVVPGNSAVRFTGFSFTDVFSGSKSLSVSGSNRLYCFFFDSDSDSDSDPDEVSN